MLIVCIYLFHSVAPSLVLHNCHQRCLQGLLQCCHLGEPWVVDILQIVRPIIEGAWWWRRDCSLHWFIWCFVVMWSIFLRRWLMSRTRDVFVLVCFMTFSWVRVCFLRYIVTSLLVPDFPVVLKTWCVWVNFVSLLHKQLSKIPMSRWVCLYTRNSS